MNTQSTLLESHDQSVDVDAELDRLAARYRGASGLGIELLNLIGGQAESLLERLPKPVRQNLDAATTAALSHAMKAAQGSRRVVPHRAGWLNTSVATALGAVGGIGGIPSALAELPITTTVLLRSIQDVAIHHGFDPGAESVQFDCIKVFSAAGPLEKDDGADLAFVSTRLALTGGAMQALVARIAPKLAVVLGQKLAAQAVPVLGAVAGAATNYTYTTYYTDIAHVHFGLRKLAVDADRDHGELVAALIERVAPRVEQTKS